jgi:hypothetical protein
MKIILMLCVCLVFALTGILMELYLCVTEPVYYALVFYTYGLIVSSVSSLIQRKTK